MIYSCATNNFSTEFLTDFGYSIIGSCLLIFFMAILIFSLASYCLKSIGIYKIAKNRNFNNAYLSWFPFARHYLFGKISDDINKQKNVESSQRGILLVLSVLNGIGELIFCVFLFISVVELMKVDVNSYAVSYTYWANKINFFLTMLTIIYMVSLLFNIFYCICAHNIFKDYVPKLSGLLCFLVVLSLFVFNDSLIDSVIFLSISTNEPESLKHKD